MVSKTTHPNESTDTQQSKGMRIPTHWVAYASFGGSGCFIVCVLALHWLQPGLSPLDHAMSDYAHGRGGWLTTVGLLALGLGSLALTVGLARHLHRRSARIGEWCLAIWGVCGLVGGIFRDDLPGQPFTLSGSLHGSAALLGITALSIAVFLLAWSIRRDPHWHRSARLLFLLAFITVGGFVLLFLSFVPVLTTGHAPILFGLLERIFFAIALTDLSVAAIGLLQAVDRASTGVRERESHR